MRSLSPMSLRRCDSTMPARCITVCWHQPEYDGSFYTKNTSAVLLARLALTEDATDWSDADAIANL